MRASKTLLLVALLSISAIETLADTTTNATPPAATPAPIPEEARKHFVMGETIFKEAKSADNFSLAAREFATAAELAPQWPEARYNLALTREVGGDLFGAIADLKQYQQFKLSDTEARKVQDKIYQLEAKQQMKQAEKNVPEKVTIHLDQLKRNQEMDFLNGLEGALFVESTGRFYMADVGKYCDNAIRIKDGEAFFLIRYFSGDKADETVSFHQKIADRKFSKDATDNFEISADGGNILEDRLLDDHKGWKKHVEKKFVKQ